jgi:two-component system catabolic regulation response regulator CreB
MAMDGLARVLVALAESGRAGFLAECFARRGVLPSLAFTREQAERFVDQEHFDLVVLGLSAGARGRSDAAGLVRFVAQRNDGALVVLSAREDIDARLLAAGCTAVLPADTAPDDVASLALQVFAPLAAVATRKAPLQWGPLQLDPLRRDARWKGCAVPVTKLQFRLLICLVAAQGAVVTREELQRALYGGGVVDDGDRVMAHVRRLRDKLEQNPSRPRFLLTVRGEGFRLADDDRAPVAV